jgi:hypothetical protein
MQLDMIDKMNKMRPTAGLKLQLILEILSASCLLIAAAICVLANRRLAFHPV